MKKLSSSLRSLVIILLLLLSRSAQATVVIETVPVGNPGNPGDGFESTLGSVAYEYQIGKYEVTAGQYTEFLNAVAATDTYGLYNDRMWTIAQGCKIERSGSAGSYSYSVASDYADRPVNVIGWGDAARFANWMHNGQPTGAQGHSTTEDGSYFLNGADDDVSLMAVTRKEVATWVITSEDEWYKAAYHKNDGVTDSYWLLPTQSDSRSAVGRDLTESSNAGNNANYYGNGVPYPIDDIYYTTEVGEFELSEGAYGTFDQAGNIYEWIENFQTDDTERGVRGAGWGTSDFRNMWSEWQSSSFLPKSEDYRADFGFRLASLEPTALDGDLNGDGFVGQDDLNLVLASWGQTVGPDDPADPNNDLFVGQDDLNPVLADWGQGTPAVAAIQQVPEPQSVGLLIAGIVGLLGFRLGCKNNVR